MLLSTITTYPETMRRRSEDNRLNRGRPSVVVQVYHAEPELITAPKTTAMNKPWQNPMPDFIWSLPAGRYNERAFGYRGSKTLPALEKISSGINTGLFLESSIGTRVSLVEDGTVLAIRDFKLKQRTQGANNKLEPAQRQQLKIDIH